MWELSCDDQRRGAPSNTAPPPAVCTDSDYSASSPTLGVGRLLSFSHSHGWDLVAHCGFSLRFHDEGCCQLCFHQVCGPFVHLLYRRDSARLLPTFLLFPFLLVSGKSCRVVLCTSPVGAGRLSSHSGAPRSQASCPEGFFRRLMPWHGLQRRVLGV